jgi:EGF domain/Calcium-binding EGF domain
MAPKAPTAPVSPVQPDPAPPSTPIRSPLTAPVAPPAKLDSPSAAAPVVAPTRAPTCQSGYALSNGLCVDVDECALPTMNACILNAKCTNTPGSYNCACNIGFRGDGYTSCTDIDECSGAVPPCDPNAACTNTPGSFSCACKAGYNGDGKNCAKEYYKDVVQLSDSKIAAVMNWIKSKVTLIKTPFCSRDGYVRGDPGVFVLRRNCPAGTEFIFCYESCFAFCPAGYKRYSFGATCLQECPKNFIDQELSCKLENYGLNSYSSETSCEVTNGAGNCEYCNSRSLFPWNPKCKLGFDRYNCTHCTANPDCNSFGLGARSGKTCAKRNLTSVEADFVCPPKFELYTDGYCYLPCNSTKYTPTYNRCLVPCQPSQFSCSNVSSGSDLCAKDYQACVDGIEERPVEPFVSDTNVATLGLVAGVSSRNVTVKTAAGMNSTVVGTKDIGKSFVDVVNRLMAPSFLRPAVVYTRVRDPKTGGINQTIQKTGAMNVDVLEAMVKYRDAFVEDLANQTSASINNVLNARYHAETAKFLKKVWADIHLIDMIQINGWLVNRAALSEALMVDLTGVNALLAAYTKQICSAELNAPCIGVELAQICS